MSAFTVEQESGIPILLAGEWIDITNSGTLREQLEGLLEDGSSAAIIDLTETQYIDSSGLAALVGTANTFQEADVPLALCGLVPNVLKIIELTSLDDFFQIETDRKSAIDAVTSAA